MPTTVLERAILGAFDRRSASRWRLGFGSAVAVLLLWFPSVRAAEEGDLPVITEPSLLWAMPTAQKSREHPLRLEGRVSFFDPIFKMMWLERDGAGTYVQLSEDAPVVRTGQYIVIEGTVIPNHGLEATRAIVRVLRESEPVVPLEPGDRLGDLDAFQSRIVVVEAYVDSQLEVDPNHHRLELIVGDRPIICWVVPERAGDFGDWKGRRVRITGLYSGRFDPTRTRTTIELWVGDRRQVTDLGEIGGHPGFALPLTPVEALYQQKIGAFVHVRGRVDIFETEHRLILHDGTGQVGVRTLQRQRVPVGTEIEVIGRLESSGGQWELGAALYRQTGPVAEKPADGVLRSIAAIRNLSAEEAARTRPVEITGMTTWSLPVANFLFLQDVTGGIRVHYDRARTGTIPYGKYFRMTGVTRAGRFAPEVELRDFTDLGSMSHPAPRPVSYEQAITGREDGQWVEMRGFLREVTAEGDWRWLHVTTAGGSFVGHLQTPVRFVAKPGALLRIQGVCETNEDAGGRITGITLRVPFVHDIFVEDEAPADPFDVPPRSVRSLDQLSDSRNLMRVRVEGTVLHAEEGRLAYLQEQDTGLLVLGPATPPLAPGDRVEAVGILGREGVRPLLREAVFRRLGSGPPPPPPLVANPVRLMPEFDARLVRIAGTLMDVSVRARGLALTLRHGGEGAIFEAQLEDPPEGLADRLPGVGAELVVTGLYRLIIDDARQSRGFQLNLRSVQDIEVVRAARIWTLPRALAATAVLAGATVLGLALIYSLRRQVRRQTEQIRLQLAKQAQLETEVQHAARLEALGELAGGIAHDFNNALTGILGNLSLLKYEPGLTNAQDSLLRQMELSATRAKGLTQQLQTFARGGDPIRHAERLPEIVRTAVESAVHGTRTGVEFEFADGLWNALIDREQMEHAIRNIALHSVGAMSGEGRLTVTAGNFEPGQGPAILPSNRYLRLTIRDSGPGFDSRQLPRIFDPYFSTAKGSHRLGLATAHSIIRKHGGYVQVESVPGEGSVFTLWLLAAPAATGRTGAVAEVAPRAARVPAGGRPRVLLMDDEEMVRNLASQVLARIGCETVTATDGAAALVTFAEALRSDRPFSLVILDLTVPGGMGGRETIEEIRKMDARVPAIVSSGYSDDPVMANHRQYGFDAVVPKPYEVEVLVAAVRRFVPAGELTKP